MAKTLQRENSRTRKSKQFSENELQELRTAFELIDLNQDGQLNINELNRMLTKLGIELNESTLKDLICTASRSGKEIIDEDEFLQWVQKIQDLAPWSTDDESPAEDVQENLLAAFRVFDLDQNGYITRDELKTAMETIGESVTEQQITDFLTMADTDKDGRINYEEFARLLL